MLMYRRKTQIKGRSHSRFFIFDFLTFRIIRITSISKSNCAQRRMGLFKITLAVVAVAVRKHPGSNQLARRIQNKLVLGITDFMTSLTESILYEFLELSRGKSQTYEPQNGVKQNMIFLSSFFAMTDFREVDEVMISKVIPLEKP